MSEISNPMQELEIPSAAVMREKVDSYWADDCKAVLNETADALRLICSQIEASADRGADFLVVNVEKDSFAVVRQVTEALTYAGYTISQTHGTIRIRW
jgi:hypothetical protein